MKVLITVLAVVSLGLAAPTPRRLFHRHYEDLLNTLWDESGDQIDRIIDRYYYCNEYWASINFLQSSMSTTLLYNVLYTPEFQAVNEFLEENNIDINYFISFERTLRGSAHPLRRYMCTVDGKRDFTALLQDIIKIWPREKITALYEQKLAEDETFRKSMESFQSEEWKELYSALRDTTAFQLFAEIYKKNGIDVDVYITLIKMLFGQE